MEQGWLTDGMDKCESTKKEEAFYSTAYNYESEENELTSHFDDAFPGSEW